MPGCKKPCADRCNEWLVYALTAMVLLVSVPRWSLRAQVATEGQAPPAPQEKTTEFWLGALSVSGMELRLLFEFEKNASGIQSGSLVSLDQGEDKIPLEKIQLEGNALSVSVPSIKASFQGKVAEDEKSVEGTWTQLGKEMPLTVHRVSGPPKEVVKDVWGGTLKALGQELEVQLRLLDIDGKPSAKFDSLTQKVKGLPATIERNDDRLVFAVPAIRGKFDGGYSEAKDQIDGNWSQMGLQFELVLKKRSAAAEPPPKPNRPQTPKPPFSYQSEDVKFKNAKANIQLAGTLTRPKGEGPFPAVVLVTGSGPQDRDETLMDHKPFFVLADHLTRNGVAVLRYDDRGTHQSEGDFTQATTRDFAEDAAAAIEWLKQQASIDAERIGVIGHSEGGIVAAMLAAERKDLAHVVMMAGPGVPGSDIIETQQKAILESMGMSSDAVSEARDHVLHVISWLETGKSQEEVLAEIERIANEMKIDDLQGEEDKKQARAAHAGMLRQLASPWFSFFVKYNPRTDLERAQCPVLALIGEKDLQVLVETNMPEIEGALKKSGRTDHQCRVIPGVNHLFQEAKTGSPHEYALIEQTIRPDVLEEISKWVLEH